MFFDTDDDAEFRPQGPPLLHFLSTPLSDIQPARRKDWKKILLEKFLSLHATSIQIFDGHGNFCSFREFQNPE